MKSKDIPLYFIILKLPCPERSFGCQKQQRDQQMRQKASEFVLEANSEKQKQNNLKVDKLKRIIFLCI